MATNRWIGNAIVKAQVNTITPANVASTNVFNVTINGKTISYTAVSADTAATVCAALVALLNAKTAPPEFQEITWAVAGATITATADTPGMPFTQTSTASGGTAALTTSSAAGSGPNDVSCTANWSTGSLPATGDTVIIENTGVSLLYNLSALSAVTLAVLNIPASFTGQIGLSQFTASAGGYSQYRPQYLQVSATAVTIGAGSGGGSNKMKLDFGSNAYTANVYQTAQAADAPLPALLIKGTHADNVLNVNRGSVGVAMLGGEISTVDTFSAGYVSNTASDVALQFGSGCTLTTGSQSGGVVTLNCAVTTYTKMGGTLNQTSGGITSLENVAGVFNYTGAGTIGDYTGGANSTFNSSGDLRAKTVTDCSLARGATINDPFRTVTWTNGIVLSLCGIADVTLNLGLNITLTPASD